MVCGANFPNCPRTTVYEASERDFRVVVAEDALSGLYDKGAAELRAIGVALMPAAEVVGAVDAAGAGLGPALSSDDSTGVDPGSGGPGIPPGVACAPGRGGYDVRTRERRWSN